MTAAYTPGIQIRLIKTAKRSTVGGQLAAASRYKDFTALDLTPYLAEGTAVTVQRSLASPAGGWGFQLVDRMVPGYDESLYALIEPQDAVEIRMAHNPADYQGKLPIAMRGFVSRITRSRGIGPDGRPMRTVSISGHDYGKILQVLRIYYLVNSVVGDNITASLKLFQKYASYEDAKIVSAADFVLLLNDTVISTFIGALTKDANGEKVGAGSIIQSFTPQVSIKGLVSPQDIAAFEGGSMYDFLRTFLDIGAFNELLVEDTETSVDLVIRPNAFLGIDNKPIQSAQVAGNTAEDPNKDKIAQLKKDGEALRKEAAAIMEESIDLLSETAALISKRDAAAKAGDKEGAAEYHAQARAKLAASKVKKDEALRKGALADAADAEAAKLENGNASAVDLSLGVPVIDIPDTDLVNITESRSDDDVANYFWVENGAWQIINNMPMKELADAGKVADYALMEYANTASARFGFKKLETSSALGPDGLLGNDTATKAQVVNDSDLRLQWLVERRKILADQNKDNVVFESGQMLVRGNERIRRGGYVRVHYGDYSALYYVTNVVHQFVLYGACLTHVTFERGANFIARAQRDRAPYIAEMSLKGAA
jgi:hypothetical protein